MPSVSLYFVEDVKNVRKKKRGIFSVVVCFGALANELAVVMENLFTSPPGNNIL